MHNKYDGLIRGTIGFVTWIFSLICAMVFFLMVLTDGAFGFNTQTTVSTTNFTKALTSDHSGVTIVYANKPYLFNQFNVVYNFEDITNILIYEKKSTLGAQLAWEVQVVTPQFRPKQVK